MGQKASRLHHPHLLDVAKPSDGRQPSHPSLPIAATTTATPLPATHTQPQRRRRSIQLPLFSPREREREDKENIRDAKGAQVVQDGKTKTKTKTKATVFHLRRPKSAVPKSTLVNEERGEEGDLTAIQRRALPALPAYEKVELELRELAAEQVQPALETVSIDVPVHEDVSTAHTPPQAQETIAPKQEERQPRLRIAIVGGGIGGLSLATFLKLSHPHPHSHSHSSDIELDIYEAAPSLTELGAGVGMWLRTWRVMRDFSLDSGSSARSPSPDDDNNNSSFEGAGEGSKGEGKREEGEEETLVQGLTKIGPPGRDMGEGLRKAFEFRKGDECKEGTSFYTMEVPFGVLTLHRADFQQVLARRAIPPARPHFGKRLADYTEDPHTRELTLHFTDGTRATCDVLIGADGIRSVTRGVMYRRLVESGEVDLARLGGSKAVAGAGAVAGADFGENPPTVAPPLSIASATTTMTTTTDERERDAIADFVDPVWSGTLVYRALIPKAALDKRWPGHRVGLRPVCYFGKSKHVLAFPIMHISSPPDDAQGKDKESAKKATPMVNLVAFTSQPEKEGTRIEGAWVRPAPHANLLQEFEGWEEEVRALLELVGGETKPEPESASTSAGDKGEDENANGEGEGDGGRKGDEKDKCGPPPLPLLWAIHVVKPLPKYVGAGGRVVLVGDAAHAMTPHQGAGGGQAIEDAYVLAALLAHPRTTRETLGLAMRAYERVRIPVSREVARKSRLNGMMYEFNAGPGSGSGSTASSSSSPPLCRSDNGDEGEEEKEIADDDSGVYVRREEEAARLKALATAIMDIHKWEWEEPADVQPREAVRMFEEMFAGGGDHDVCTRGS